MLKHRMIGSNNRTHKNAILYHLFEPLILSTY